MKGYYMAIDTPSSFRNLVLYSIYVRNHGPNGTFHDVERDLPRIKNLGVDVVWFMPIHPIGQLNKKGSLGCPYSIQDYRGVNPEYGTREDFARLIERAHGLGLKVMIDVVYNHTAHDSVLVHEHPEYFHQDAEGKPVTTVPEWSDVIDLKHPNPELTAYLIETLQGWAEFGVDGFRCDVASLLPQEFWLQARQAVAQVKPGVIWLAEAVHAGFVSHRRANGLSGLSDSEIYAAFDLTYDYDIWPIWQLAVQGKIPVRRYVEMLRFQDSIYPANFIKMRCVENHDQARIMRLASSQRQASGLDRFCGLQPGRLPDLCRAGIGQPAHPFAVRDRQGGVGELQPAAAAGAAGEAEERPGDGEGQIRDHPFRPGDPGGLGAAGEEPVRGVQRERQAGLCADQPAGRQLQGCADG